MSKEDIVQHQFKKGESGNPKGRPPKLLTELLEDLRAEGFERVTTSQVVDAYETLFGLPVEKLRAVAINEKLPMISRIVAKAMLSTKGFEILEKMLDRAQGRPKQSIDAEVTGGINIALVEFLEADDGNNQDTSQDTE